MVDSISAQKALPQFTTIKYTTKDGENITATKKDRIVTLSGDKNGIRQMPIDDFVKKELVENLQNVKLENSPEADTVDISTKAAPIEAPKAETPKDDNKVEVGKKLDIAA